MKQQYIGLKTIEAEPKTHHQFLQVIDPEIVLAEYPDGPGYAFTDDNGDPAWLPAEAFEEIFRASAPAIDETAIWKAVNGVVAPAPADAPAKVLTGPRVTLEGVLAKVKGEEFFRVGPTLTICVLTLENGAHMTGESACVAVENFDEELGRKIAKDKAISKAMELEGYLLREKLYRNMGRRLSIARVCHEVNRAYCESLGDMSQPKWEDAPSWQRDSALNGVNLHMDGEHGPEASHEAWMAQKLAEGWKYGPVKDPEAKEHPCLVPFEQLPKEQQAKDFIFRSVVAALA